MANGRAHIIDVVEFVNSAAEEANDPVFGRITDNDKLKKVSTTKVQPKFPRVTGFSVNT
jgi:hypothetical protein